MRYTFSEEVMLGLLNGLVAVGKPLDGAKVALACNLDILTDRSVLADLVVPTYGGYAPSTAVVWGTAHHNRDNSVECLAGSKTFAPTDSTSSSSITYAVLTNGAGDTLLASLKLDEAVTLGTPDDHFTICFPILLSQSDVQPGNVVP